MEIGWPCRDGNDNGHGANGSLAVASQPCMAGVWPGAVIAQRPNETPYGVDWVATNAGRRRQSTSAAANEDTMVQTRQDTERALATLEERIARFADLEPDWDSYGAKPIFPEAIAKAQNVLRSLIQRANPRLEERVLSVWIAPLPNGGVLLEWRRAMADVEVEVTADGALDLVVEQRVGEADETFERADIPVEEIASLLDDVLAA